jgi:hypothetical protein
LNIKLGKIFELSVPITHSLNAKIELVPELDPVEEVKVSSLDDLIEPNLEDDAQFFIDEEENEGPIEHEPLDELLELPKPSIELKPLPSSLRYAFLNSDQDSPVIISDKLSGRISTLANCPRKSIILLLAIHSKTLREPVLLFAPIASLQI